MNYFTFKLTVDGIMNDFFFKMQVRDWTNIAGKADNARTVCLMLIVLDNLVTMNTDSKIRLELCLLQIQLIDNIQRAQVCCC
jgi:hypothetical protein